MPVTRLRHTAQAALLVVASMFCSGCVSMAGLQDMHFSYCNKYRASEAWKCSFNSTQRKSLSDDFEKGFKQGYYDTAMNKDCRLPPVAPPKYWSARYQSCEGQCKVQDWFRGYQHGIAAAQSYSCPDYVEVPVSPNAPIVNKTGCGACYSADHCKCNQGCENSESYSQPEIQLPVESFPYDYNTSGVIKSTEPMLDAPNSLAIVPASFGSDPNVGLIGGLGNKEVN